MSSYSCVYPYCDHKHIDENLSLTERGERMICNNLFQNIDKIKPLMIGPRRLAYGNTKVMLKKSYTYNLRASNNDTVKKLMCYFGNALGPVPSKDIKKPDFDWEADLMAWFSGSLNHPNEKRTKAAKIISHMGVNYDARIISDGNADKIRKKNKLVIPLKDFCNYVAGFQYNFNISGYRMSIPNRFADSFMAGTAVFTDKLKVKWYLPFNKEVVETVEMGYLPNDEVNWDKFENDLKSLPLITKVEIVSEFNKKWSPDVVAKYIINTIEASPI
jgi:hypothetical protein